MSLLLFYRVSNSSSEAVISFCASSLIEFKQLKSHILFLKSNEDKIYAENHCLNLKTLDTKEVLFTKYIRRKLPLVQITTSNGFSQDKVCRFKVKKWITRTEAAKKFNHLKNNLSAESKIKLENFTEVIETSTYGDLFTTIDINDASFKIFCKKKNSESFLVKIKTKSPKLSMESTLSLKPGKWTRIGEYNVKGFSKSKEIAIINNKLNNASKIERVQLEIKVK
jgi:hypothetical protein